METMNGMSHFYGAAGVLDATHQRRDRLEGIAFRHRLTRGLGRRRGRRGRDPGRGGTVVELPLDASSPPRPVSHTAA